MEQHIVIQLVKRVFDLLEEALEVRGKTLEVRLRKARRMLPARVRRAGAVLVEAEALSQDPQLAQRLDSERVAEAYDILVRFLKDFDVTALKSRKRYNLAAGIAAQIIVVVVAVVLLLRWRGYI